MPEANLSPLRGYVVPAFAGAACQKAKTPRGTRRSREPFAPSARPEQWTEPRRTAAAAEAGRRCGARGPGVRDAGGPRAAAAAPPAPLRLWPAATPHLAGPLSGRAFSCAPRSGPSWPAPATKVERWGDRGRGARRGLEVRVGARWTLQLRKKPPSGSGINVCRQLSVALGWCSALWLYCLTAAAECWARTCLCSGWLEGWEVGSQG